MPRNNSILLTESCTVKVLQFNEYLLTYYKVTAYLDHYSDRSLLLQQFFGDDYPARVSFYRDQVLVVPGGGVLQGRVDAHVLIRCRDRTW